MELDIIYNEDCLNGLKRIPSNSIDLVITDPPYILENKGGGIYKQDDKKYAKELENIKKGFDIKILDELCRVMKKINIYIWCSQKQIVELINYFTNKNCNWNLITWHKSNPLPACSNKYLTDTEYCLFFREKGVKILGTFETKFTYYITPLNVADKHLWVHPTVKPIEIIKNFIINSSLENDIVLDCFMGSGTTAVACKETGRHYIGFEINKEYCDIANDRLKGITKQDKQRQERYFSLF